MQGSYAHGKPGKVLESLNGYFQARKKIIKSQKVLEKLRECVISTLSLK